MNYELNKKKLMNKGGTPLKARENRGKQKIINDFKNDLSYRSAIMVDNKAIESSLDIRLVNIDKTTDEKKILLLPDVTIPEGSYVKFSNKTFIVKTIEDNTLSPYLNSFFCNQILKWENSTGSLHEFPCLMSNDSYGAKLVTSDTLSNIDTKMKIEVQYNEFTKAIKRDMRFMFEKSEFDIFKVVDITTSVYKGIIVLTCQKDLRIAEDDIENNLAWNKKDEITPPPVIGYNILGDFEISFGKTNEFTIDPLTNVTWSLEQAFNVCEIVSFTNNTCKVKALIKDEFSTLIASVNGEEIARMDIETMR